MMRTRRSCVVAALLLVLVDREQALAPTPVITRRGALEQGLSTTATLLLLTGAATTQPALAAAEEDDAAPAAPQEKVWKPNGVVLKNGLRYFDYEEGAGPTPRWGQVVSFEFTQSVRKAPGAKLQKIFSSDGYLIKHGNGRTIKGLDEGLHTMKVGGRRRIEVPAEGELAYAQNGLGPLPEWAPTFRKFQKALKEVEPGGAIVFDVTMNKIKTDGADRGYYEDNSFTEAELTQIIANTEAAAKQFAREARKKDPLAFPEARQPELSQ